MAFQCLITSFFLENIVYCQEQFGYEVFGHFCVTDNVIDSCCKIATDTDKKRVIVVFGAKKVKYCKPSEFRNECSTYFERYYKKLIIHAPLVLPSAIPTKFKGIVETMKGWHERNKVHEKGFVLHNFLFKDLYLKMYNDELGGLRRKLNIEDFPSTPIVTIYNPKETIIFLISMTENEDVESEAVQC